MKQECEVIRDGKFLFDKFRPCPYEKYEDAVRDSLEEEANDYYYQQEQEDQSNYLQEEEIYNQNKKKILEALKG